MKKSKNEMYALVDEEFLAKFSNNHLQFMKDRYYKFYCEFCEWYKRKPLSQQEFFSNMHRRRIQLYQLCCPYCGTIHVTPFDKKEKLDAGLNYCYHCGKGSTVYNIKIQIARFARINGINRLGLKVFREMHPDVEEWLLAYDCYQMEIIELASIIEVVFRDYYEALHFIYGLGGKGDYNKYIKKVVDKQNGNDFMNIEKTNNIYKKAFGINLKENMDKKIWNDLIDIVNLRNMMIHNNGRVDGHFRNTSTYLRLKKCVDGNLLRIEDKDIANYLESVMVAVTNITDIYLERYYLQRNVVIANYYFNNRENGERIG